MRNEMRYLTLILPLTLVIGCTSIEIQQTSPITPGQIFVERFTGTYGEIVTSAIEIEFSKKGLLTTRDQAKYILTGNATYSPWTADTISFNLKDKTKNSYLRGNSVAAGALPTAAGKELAKKILKKF